MYSSDFLHEVLLMAEIVKDVCMAELMLDETTDERERYLLDTIADSVEAGLAALQELDKIAAKN